MEPWHYRRCNESGSAVCPRCGTAVIEKENRLQEKKYVCPWCGWATPYGSKIGR